MVVSCTECAVPAAIIASKPPKSLHFSVKVSPAGKAQRAGSDNRIGDIADSGILPFNAIYITKQMSCTDDSHGSDAKS